jgi:hypothetical protein
MKVQRGRGAGDSPESYPSGSSHTVWRSLCPKRRTLASKDGQYRGPVHSIQWRERRSGVSDYKPFLVP